MVSNSLLRKLSTEPVFRRPNNAAMQRNNIRHLLLDSEVELVLGTPTIPIKLSSLLNVRPGQILPLRRSIEMPCTLRLGGRDCWLARPVQSEKRRRAAQLVERLEQPEEWEEANGQPNRRTV
jgi:flagellar motor switch protein FliM